MLKNKSFKLVLFFLVLLSPFQQISLRSSDENTSAEFSVYEKCYKEAEKLVKSRDNKIEKLKRIIDLCESNLSKGSKDSILNPLYYYWLGKLYFEYQEVKRRLGLDYLGDLESSISYNTKALEEKWLFSTSGLTPDIYKTRGVARIIYFGEQVKKNKKVSISNPYYLGGCKDLMTAKSMGIKGTEMIIEKYCPSEDFIESDLKKYQEFVFEGLNAYFKKDYQKAIQIFEQAISFEPNFKKSNQEDKLKIIASNCYLGISKYYLGDYEGAKYALGKSIELLRLKDLGKIEGAESFSSCFHSYAITKAGKKNETEFSKLEAKEIKDLYKESIKLSKTNFQPIMGLIFFSSIPKKSHIAMINEYIEANSNIGDRLGLAYWVRANLSIDIDGPSGEACADLNKAIKYGYEEAESSINKFDWCQKYNI